ncbi:MAG TPA: pentapeptide repeat-containing protein, partial [Bacteroidales bacterium]
FNGSDLSGLLLKTNNVESCDFSGSDIGNSRIQGSNLLNNLFKDSSLKGTDFSESNIDRCDFSGANFNGTKFSKSYMYGCDFSGADFTGAVIKSGGFTGVKSKDLKRNTIINAVWNRTSFIDAQIADIVFTGTLEDCYFENCKFTRVIFRDATLINTFFKNNKNLKRIRFIDCKADRMTYEFLKQGNADLSGITLLTSRGGNE